MAGKTEMSAYAILIATRNRPKKILLLLESIKRLAQQPSQIVIVASGDSIESQVSHFEHELNIEYLHLSQKGQIRQKIEGLKLIDISAEWILFLDDDVLLKEDSITNAFQYINAQEQPQQIVGIGFKNANSISVAPSAVRKITSRFFGISNRRKGGVANNGQAIDYMDSLEVIETQWLNGISMWRKDVAIEYNIPFLDAPYSICEDLIFSYSTSKKGKLVFLPDSKFVFQEESTNINQTFEVLRATAYWRLYFVLSNKEFNVRKFLWSQVGRTISYCLVSGGRELPLAKRIWKSIGIFIDLTYLIAFKTPAIKVLQLRQSGV